MPTSNTYESKKLEKTLVAELRHLILLLTLHDKNSGSCCCCNVTATASKCEPSNCVCLNCMHYETTVQSLSNLDRIKLMGDRFRRIIINNLNFSKSLKFSDKAGWKLFLMFSHYLSHRYFGYNLKKSIS